MFSGDETADVGKDDATQVVHATFKDVHDSEFTGSVKKVVISIPEKKEARTCVRNAANNRLQRTVLLPRR